MKIAGLRSGTTLEWMKNNQAQSAVQSNTVIGAVATNAKLTKVQATKVAQMAQDGLAQAIRPAHTMFDGDTIFALATGEVDADVSTVGAFAAEVMAQAIVRSVRMAASARGTPRSENKKVTLTTKRPEEGKRDLLFHGWVYTVPHNFLNFLLKDQPTNPGKKLSY